MLTIRRLLPGEERVYNEAHTFNRGSDNVQLLENKEGHWLAAVLDGGQIIIEAIRPCSVRFKDGGRAVILDALKEIAHDTDNVRHARVVARRALREAEE